MSIDIPQVERSSSTFMLPQQNFILVYDIRDTLCIHHLLTVLDSDTSNQFSTPGKLLDVVMVLRSNHSV